MIWFLLGLIFWPMLMTSPVAAADRIILPAPEDAIDTRRDYYIQLLKLALEKTRTSHGDYRILTSPAFRLQERVIRDMVSDVGDVNLVFSGTSRMREENLLPIRVPLAKGLLGFRIFIIRRDRAAEFAKLTDEAQLKMLRPCQGIGWPDTDILRHAGFQVEAPARYESLFKMVSLGRCDFFPRAIHEPYLELFARQDKYPDLMVEKTWLIRYPFATYFFTKKKDYALAKRIETGLKQARLDGSFEHLLKTHPAIASSIEEAQPSSRKVMNLDNPLLPPDTPLDELDLWYQL